ncbi:MAG: thiamine phosphate synthase [Nitrospirae bacterium]|nr:thiamine phosphate synthase [Nitrospirota bacterium]
MDKLFTKKRALYLITDRIVSGLSHVEMAERAIAGGAKIIQMREKLMSRRDIYEEATALRKITAMHDVLFIVNDYVDVAFAVDADGVHLGQDDMPLKEARKILGPEKIIGISTHNLNEALKAEDDGADYIGFGPIFHTKTKDAGPPKGLEALRRLRPHINIPIVAVGGITMDSVKAVMEAGADAVALASGIFSTPDIEGKTREILSVIKNKPQSSQRTQRVRGGKL